MGEPGGLPSMGLHRVEHDWSNSAAAATEAEDIKKTWQEYTEELYKKDLHNPDNHDGVITHLEPDPGMWSQVDLRKHHYEQS